MPLKKASRIQRGEMGVREIEASTRKCKAEEGTTVGKVRGVIFTGMQNVFLILSLNTFSLISLQSNDGVWELSV